MHLYLIRHPKPDVAAGICYGASNLTVPVEEQARVVSLLTPALPRGVPVYSSPLRRCAEFAACLVAVLEGDAVIHDSRLAEMNFGNWEMRSWNDIPRAEIDAWTDSLINYRPGGGESVMQVMLCVDAFVQVLRDQKHQEAIVVCHAGTIRLLLVRKDGGSLTEAALVAAQSAHQIAYGAMIRIDIA